MADDGSLYVEDANGTVYLARPVARMIDRPLGIGADWLVDYDTDPTLDNGVLLYVLDLHDPAEQSGGSESTRGEA